MKKILLLAILSIVIVTANAQVEKGSILLGGNFGGNISSTGTSPDVTKNSNWHFNPSLGFAYKTNRVFGVSLGYAQSKYKATTSTTVNIDRNYDISAGAYLRRYLPLAKNFSMFGQGDFRLGYGKRNITNTASPYSTIEKSYGAYLSFTPGVAYAITKKFMLETSFGNMFSLGYNRMIREYKGPTPSPSNKTTNIGFSGNATPGYGLNLGLRIILGNK